MKYLAYLKLLLVFFTLNACDSDCNTPEEYPLPKQGLYNGTETLRFLHNNTDTQVYVGQGARRQWIKVPAADETQCPKSYEEVEYTFSCTSNNNVIKITRSTWLNLDNPFGNKLYFNNVHAGLIETPKGSIPEMTINGKKYARLRYRSPSVDTPYYFLCTFHIDSPDFILKIKYPGDTLTLIK